MAFMEDEPVVKYTIISINDERSDYKDAIRAAMHNHEEVFIPSVNGEDPEDIAAAREFYGDIEPKGWSLNAGQYGIWYSQLNCWRWAAQNGDLIMFEDDAIVSEEFDVRMALYLKELPSDYDMFSLFVPDNQLQDFRYRQNYDPITGEPCKIVHAGDPGYKYAIDGLDYVVRAYQGYSCVANMISSKGAQKLLDLMEQRPIYATVDCFLFLEAHLGKIDAYAHHPQQPRPVTYNWDVPSIIWRPTS